jgi:hypothetical protein
MVYCVAYPVAFFGILAQEDFGMENVNVCTYIMYRHNVFVWLHILYIVWSFGIYILPHVLRKIWNPDIFKPKILI